MQGGEGKSPKIKTSVVTNQGSIIKVTKVLIILLQNKTPIHITDFHQLPFLPHIKIDNYGPFFNYLSPDSNLMTTTGTCC